MKLLIKGKKLLVFIIILIMIMASMPQVIGLSTGTNLVIKDLGSCR